MKREKHELTTRELYGGLNRRFDRRAALLRRLGFVYERTPYGAMFTRIRVGKLKAIPAAVVLHADNAAWFDVLVYSGGVRCGVPWRRFA